MTTKSPSRLTTRPLTRWLLLLLILLAFARLVWRLDAKDLWLDESFSVQRAESSWIDILRDVIPISDGVETIQTIDQHPFAFFALLGLAVRLLGQSDLRCAFLLLRRRRCSSRSAGRWRDAARRGSVPPAAPVFAALLAALNPFYLWYGQEVRMYAQVGFLAILSLYLLLRWAEAGDRRSRLTLVAWIPGCLAGFAAPTITAF